MRDHIHNSSSNWSTYGSILCINTCFRIGISISTTLHSELNQIPSKTMQLICNINAKKIQWDHAFIPVHILPRGLQNPQKNHTIIQFLNKFPQQTSPRYITFWTYHYSAQSPDSSTPLQLIKFKYIFKNAIYMSSYFAFLSEMETTYSQSLMSKSLFYEAIHICVCVCVCVRICTIDVQEPSFSDMLICDSCQHLKTCWKMGAFQLEGIS